MSYITIEIPGHSYRIDLPILDPFHITISHTDSDGTVAIIERFMFMPHYEFDRIATIDDCGWIHVIKERG